MDRLSKPYISVVIPVRNEANHLEAAVASIINGRSGAFPMQIVLVDDASEDADYDAITSRYSWQQHRVQIDIIRLPRWSGIPFARNAGAAMAKADLLFVTDANVRFSADWDLPVRAHSRPNRVLCATIADIGSTFRAYGGTLHLPSMGFNWLRTPQVYGGYVPLTPCTGTILPTDLFRRAGGYDTAMPVYGAAEPEFSVRLWLQGADIVVLPSLVLKHRFRPPSERRPFLEAIGTLQTYNYLRFGLLYLEQPAIQQLIDYYASHSSSHFEEALRKVWAGDVWERRALLNKRLLYSFHSFTSRFHLLEPARAPVRS